jgi:hypothetical protein
MPQLLEADGRKAASAYEDFVSFRAKRKGENGASDRGRTGDIQNHNLAL